LDVRPPLPESFAILSDVPRYGRSGQEPCWTLTLMRITPPEGLRPYTVTYTELAHDAAQSRIALEVNPLGRNAARC
jgi:hypothetical protein